MKTIITHLEPEYFAPRIIEITRPEVDAFLETNVFLGGGTANHDCDLTISPHPLRGEYVDDIMIRTTGTVRRVLCVPDKQIKTMMVLQGVDDALQINLLTIETNIENSIHMDDIFRMLLTYVVIEASKDMHLVRERILKFTEGSYDVYEKGNFYAGFERVYPQPVEKGTVQ